MAVNAKNGTSDAQRRLGNEAMEKQKVGSRTSRRVYIYILARWQYPLGLASGRFTHGDPFRMAVPQYQSLDS